jgi:uncharacterized protein DUF6796
MEIDLPALVSPRTPPHAALPPKPDTESRVFGVLGLVGAALLLCGDMLLYGHLGDGASFMKRLPEVAARASLARLFAGGALGPIGAALVTAGFWHVHLQVRPAWPRASRAMFAGFAVLMVGAGAFHALWTAYLLALRFAASTPSVLEPLRLALRSYMTTLYAVSAVPGYVACGVLLVAVASGRSRYPRWAAPINPGLLALAAEVTLWAPAPWGALAYGGSLSLTLALFFAVSLALTRRRRRARWIEDDVPGAA